MVMPYLAHETGAQAACTTHCGHTRGEAEEELYTQHLWSPHPKGRWVRGDKDAMSQEDSGLINTQVLSSALHLNTIPPTPHSVPTVTCHPRETCCPSSCPLSHTSGHILIRHPVSARHVLFNLRHPPATLYQVSHFLTWSPMNVSGTLGLILATTTENSPTGHGSHTHTHLTKALRWFAVPLISTLQLLPMPRGFLILNFIVWIYQLPLTSQHFPKF